MVRFLKEWEYVPKLECVSIHTKDIEKSAFYKEMGMEQNWVIERELEEGLFGR